MYSTSLYFGSRGSTRRKSSRVTDTQFAPVFFSNARIVASRDASRSIANIFLNIKTLHITSKFMTAAKIKPCRRTDTSKSVAAQKDKDGASIVQKPFQQRESYYAGIKATKRQ